MQIAIIGMKTSRCSIYWLLKNDFVLWSCMILRQGRTISLKTKDISTICWKELQWQQFLTVMQVWDWHSNFEFIHLFLHSKKDQLIIITSISLLKIRWTKHSRKYPKGHKKIKSKHVFFFLLRLLDWEKNVVSSYDSGPFRSVWVFIWFLSTTAEFKTKKAWLAFKTWCPSTVVPLSGFQHRPQT